MRMTQIAVCVAILSFVNFSDAQYPPGMTMHRIQAGLLDKTGWTTAKSTEGRFTVRLPLLFNDFTSVDSEPTSQVAKLYVIGGKSSEGIKFSATRTTYKNSDAAKYYFKTWVKGEVFKGEQISHKITKYRGLEAVEISASQSFSLGFARAILVDKDLLLVMVETPHVHRALAEQFKPTFFDSLEFER